MRRHGSRRGIAKVIGEGQPGIPRSFMVTFTPEQAQFIYQWMQVEGATSPQDAIRSLVSVALAADPEQGAHQARSLRAYYEVRRWVTERVMEDFKTTLTMLEQSLKDNPLP